MIPRLRPMVWLALVSLTACRAPQATEPLPPFEVLESRPASGVVRAEDLCPLRQASFHYRVVAGDRVGRTFTHTRAPAVRFGAAWSDAEGDERLQYWALDANGNIVMTAVIEHDDNAITLFRPPLIIAYRELPSGETRRVESDMLVVSKSDPRQRRESGKGTRTIEYVDDQLIRTAWGEHWAQRVVIAFRADLRLADAEKSGTIWVVPDLGPIVQQHDEQITVLAVAGRRDRQTAVLTAIEPGDGEGPSKVNGGSR